MGFSVHDTIVVFDRLRENLIEEGSEEFERVANESVNQTLVRSINTSLTLLIVLLSMYFLAGGGIQNFILALTVGVVVGAYSSIFVASPFVSWWHNKVQSND
jgi:preprotein translocase subunit SecF